MWFFTRTPDTFKERKKDFLSQFHDVLFSILHYCNIKSAFTLIYGRLGLPLCIAGGNVLWYNHFGKLLVSNKVNEFPCDTKIPLVGR